MSTYLRLMFTVYWDAMPPSTEMMYLQGPPPSLLTLSEIAAAEAQVLAMMKAHAEVGAVPMRAIFVALADVDLTPDEVAAVGWRVMALPPAA